MSGEYASLLEERARVFLAVARRLAAEGSFDVAVFALEQALQLRLKSSLLRLFGEAPRLHGIRELLGLLAAGLGEAGFSEEAEELRRFAADNRGLLWLLEEAYTMARYGARRYTRAEAEELLGLVERAWRLIEWVEARVYRGVHGQEA